VKCIICAAVALDEEGKWTERLFSVSNAVFNVNGYSVCWLRPHVAAARDMQRGLSVDQMQLHMAVQAI